MAYNNATRHDTSQHLARVSEEGCCVPVCFFSGTKISMGRDVYFTFLLSERDSSTCPPIAVSARGRRNSVSAMNDQFDCPVEKKDFKRPNRMMLISNLNESGIKSHRYREHVVCPALVMKLFPSKEWHSQFFPDRYYQKKSHSNLFSSVDFLIAYPGKIKK